MRKKSTKERIRIVRLNQKLRKRKVHRCNLIKAKSRFISQRCRRLHQSIEYARAEGKVDIQKKDGRGKNKVIVILPEKMNFNKDYDTTAIYINIISEFVKIKQIAKRNYPRDIPELCGVNFDKLREISTSAALVLTSEISNWEDSIRKKLKPDVSNWDENILLQFEQLGFFDLFDNKPINNTEVNLLGGQELPAGKSFVRYIKGVCGEKGHIRQLKEEIRGLVGEGINKWTFLHSGLDEAITNVSHHAYPDGFEPRSPNKSWYLTGSYNKKTGELKIAFYDQGVGIPNTLPTSKIKEKLLDYLSVIDVADRKKDATLLKAAMEIQRTSTGKTDRGKGLHDLLEFIKQRESGHLSILSSRGLYKFTIDNGKESTKVETFLTPINGTLIIWNVTLEKI
ncbi:hypothetical protein [Pseudoalteromonas luteoviolacea]|uniref:hypothetical protein n=1 Tax=Pseudoalteromonas luteoviolacea TaxID=43657 RepID=UPI0011533D4D|nr:hypothetical protein [Pseudoalteromonas luteoviolacea]TQF72571.1 hypothetical protein FLM44_16650 [Pseudoalteromonas luteoviolacea]